MNQVQKVRKRSQENYLQKWLSDRNIFLVTGVIGCYGSPLNFRPMNNRFAHCVSVNEATSLLCLFLSSEADDNDKQALNDEYDTFLAFAGEEDWQEEDHSDPFHLVEQDAEELAAFLVGMDDLDGEPTRLNLCRTPDDDSLDWLDEVCGEDGELNEESTYSNPDNIAFLAMVKENEERYGESDSELPPEDPSYRPMYPEDAEGYDYHENIDFKDLPPCDLEPFYEELLSGISRKQLIKRGIICDKCSDNICNQEYCKSCGSKSKALDDLDDLDGYPPGMTRCDLIHVGEIEPDED